MTTDQYAKTAARALAAATNQSYTRARYALAATGDEPGPWPVLRVDQKIRFAGDRLSFLVDAVSPDGRFVACTRASNLRRGSSVPERLYSVIDMAKGIRGTASSWGVGFTTRAECEESLTWFVNETLPPQRRTGDSLQTSEVSWRNWVWLRMHERQTDPTVAVLVPWLRQVMAQAPERNYNDHEPRTREEIAFRLGRLSSH